MAQTVVIGLQRILETKHWDNLSSITVFKIDSNKKCFEHQISILE